MNTSLKIMVLASLCASQWIAAAEESAWEIERDFKPKYERDSEADEWTAGLSLEFEAKRNIGTGDFPFKFKVDATWLEDEELNDDGIELGLRGEKFITPDEGPLHYLVGLEVNASSNQSLEDEQYFASGFVTLSYSEFSWKIGGQTIMSPTLDFYCDFVKDNEDQLAKGLLPSDPEYSRTRLAVHWEHGWGDEAGDGAYRYFFECSAEYFKENGRGGDWAATDLDDGFHYLARVEYLPEFVNAKWLKAFFFQFDSGRRYNAKRNRDKLTFGLRL